MVAASGIRSFLVENFWLPVVSESTFYNPYNTAVYALLFALGVLYIGYPAVKRTKLDLDRKFFLSLTPFVFLGGVLRASKDAAIFETFLLETPFIYIMLTLLTATILVGSLKLEEFAEIEYWKPMFASGTLLTFALLGMFPVRNPGALGTLFLVFSPFAAAVYYGTEVLFPRLADPKFQIPVVAHYFDASTSVVSLMNGGAEKHVLARIFVDTLGLPGMFVLKTAIVIPATYVVFKSENNDLRRVILFAIALLGFALGTRNIVSTVALS